jgi:L-glyceraldehyde 3-phosphate reductase
MSPKQLESAQQLVQLAKRAGTTATRLALAWCLRDERVASVIVGARTVEQLQDSLGAIDVGLDDSLLRELDRVFPS